MSTVAAVAALPVAALAVWALLHSPFARNLERRPEAGRWRTAPTPLVGGIGIYLGLAAGILLATLGPLRLDGQLLGILAGATLLFVAGLVDDVWSLPPVAKLAAQVGAAAIVLSTGTSVEIVRADWSAIPIGVVWLVAMTNAFNLLDNMDGLAGSLAVIAAGFFAADAALQHSTRLVLAVSVALAFAVLGFLPFNLRPRKRALAWMGDSGSQVIGFTLAALGLASSYTVATSTVATLVLPVLVLAVPILDTTLVTIVRLLDGRPISQGGRDHSSHRLVSLGISETGAVVLLALIAATLGGTSLAYEAFGSGRFAALGVLFTFALLVQFGSFLADVDRGTARRPLYLYTRRRSRWRARSMALTSARSANRDAARATEQNTASITKTLREKSPSGPCGTTTSPSAATSETTTALDARSASRTLAYRHTPAYMPKRSRAANRQKRRIGSVSRK